MNLRKILLLISIFAINVHAQEFNASVDNSTIGQNERFQINFKFKAGYITKIN